MRINHLRLISLIILSTLLIIPTGNHVLASSAVMSLAVKIEGGAISVGVLIQNTGNDTISNATLKITITGPSSKSYDFPLTLAPGENKTITISYTPPTAGTYNITATLIPLGVTESKEIYYTPPVVNLFWNDRVFTIVFPDSKTSSISILYYQGDTSLGATTVEPPTNVTIPSNADYIQLSIPGTSLHQDIYLPGITDTTWEFIGADSGAVSVPIYIFNQIYYDILEIKKNNKLISRIKLSQATPQVLLVPGETYTFDLYSNGTLKYSQNITLTSTSSYVVISAPSPSTLINSTASNTTLKLLTKNNTIVAILSSEKPVSGVMTIYYRINGKLVTVSSLSFVNKTTQTLTTQLDPSASLVYVKATTTLGVFENALVINQQSNSNILPTELIPNGLMIIVIGGVSLFAFTRINIELSVLLTAVLFLAMSALGLVTLPKTHLALIYALSASMFIFTRIQGRE